MDDLLTNFLASPGVQVTLTALGVKLAVEFLKKFFLKVDTGTEVDKYKLPLQLVTIICTFLATAADLASKHQLATIDPDTIVNFFTVSLPVYFAALGIGPAATSAKNQVNKVLGKTETK